VAQELDLAFVGGMVFDGVSDAPSRVDVGVAGARIAALGIDVAVAHARTVGEHRGGVTHVGRVVGRDAADVHAHDRPDLERHDRELGAQLRRVVGTLRRLEGSTLGHVLDVAAEQARGRRPKG